ncbi:unnamed protein product [Chilo suppressalis]|uniref:SCP domain-containing protein n=1 Tax=Chilo suppressalis TaxID=168631 RepID=A0ABN8ED53_CHISP|nr:unnamed protein product [Chilo suppressalis]
MINVKLVVLTLCFGFVLSSYSYCKICSNHTLCKYTMSGPSMSCKEYDASILLTKDDIINIVDKINERRHFVATGLTKLLPLAANMNKIRWSEELAGFAQRWVDQCDPAISPDREDECRDLEDTKVGQNIATVTGPTPGMHIQSLIDIWFMMSLDYRGSTSYYNQSRDCKTNYFTQLIWGETDRVGCGRAKFYVENKNTIIERLVCNFAPKGNNHGKPVYAIGYPATQCQTDMEPDNKMSGLCTYRTQNNVRKFKPNIPPVSSLLRILNLSNDSIKQEIDPVCSNLRQVKLENSPTNEQRNQKIRHVFLNNTYVTVKNIPNMQMYKKMRNPGNNQNNQRILKFQQDIGHSRVYHGQDLQFHNYRTEEKQTNMQKFEKNDFSTESYTVLPNDANYRKKYRNQECTRNNHKIVPATPAVRIEHTNCNTKANICTRQYIQENCEKSPKTNQEIIKDVGPYFQNGEPYNLCPCTSTTTCAPSSPKYQCNIHCQCIKTDYVPTQCPVDARRKSQPIDLQSTLPEFYSYEFKPNMEVRSGDKNNNLLNGKEIMEPSSKNQGLDATTTGNMFKLYPQNNNKGYAKDLIAYENDMKSDSDFIYDFSDSRERKKRTPASEMTFKPFWQMDEFNHHIPGQLKSMKYTTLPKKKTKRITHGKNTKTTELITVKFKESTSTINLKKYKITEKYLSFDELMHLRKFGSSEASKSIDGRRSDSSESATKELTTEYTTNTPFKRKKYCTRKLTCTWTAATITDANGSVIGGGAFAGDGERGSRTPPGYVDGCTRTSTCTRDYIDRNKFSTIPGDESSDSAVSKLEDEDYCEKRALNIRRRDSHTGTSTTASYYLNEHHRVTFFSNELTSSIFIYLFNLFVD